MKMTGAVASLKKHCRLVMVRPESSTLTKPKPQLPKSSSRHLTRSGIPERRAQSSASHSSTCEHKGHFTSGEHTGDTFDAQKIPSACLSWNLGQTWQEYFPACSQLCSYSLCFSSRCGGDAMSQAHAAFALCVGLIFWIMIIICVVGSFHFNIQTKQREQVQRDSVHLNNWTDSVALQDALSHHSIFPFFFKPCFLKFVPESSLGPGRAEQPIQRSRQTNGKRWEKRKKKGCPTVGMI